MCVYDDNHVTIDGDTNLAYSDDVAKRFEAYGWHVEQLGEMADDLDGLEALEDESVSDTPVPSVVSADDDFLIEPDVSPAVASGAQAAESADESLIEVPIESLIVATPPSVAAQGARRR